MTYYTKADLPEGTVLLTRRGDKVVVASDEYHSTRTFGDVWFTHGRYLSLENIGPGAYADVISFGGKPKKKAKGFAKWMQKVEAQ